MTSLALSQTEAKPRVYDRTRDDLAALYTYRYITNKQLCEVLIPSDTHQSVAFGIRATIYAITKRLFERGYVSRMWTEVRDGKMNEYMFFLTERGLNLVNHECKLGDQYDYVNPEKRPDGLVHDWKVTQEHIALVNALGVLLPLWEQRHSVLFTPGNHEPNPDAFFYIGDSYSYLENERNRQGNWRDGVSEQTRKVDRYIKYSESGAFREKWKFTLGKDVRNFFVRFILDNDHLADNFLMRVKHRHPHTNLMRFWAIGFHSFIKQPLGHVWRTAYDVGDRAYSLVDKQPAQL
jgi:hypothetical protein